MSSFVLVHGALHGGWCWERVLPLLEQQGHHVLAPDLPGLGADRTPAAEVSLELWGQFLATILRGISDPVILVGHSLGGMAISQAGEFAPDRIGALVYLTALLPQNGLSSFDLTGREKSPEETSLVRITPSIDGQSMTLDADDVRAALYGETADEWADRALSLLVPQPLAILRMPVTLTPERFGTVPRIFIECLRDRILSLRVQRAMQAGSPCKLTLAIDTDHSPFYSTPEVLAAHLHSIAVQFS